MSPCRAVEQANAEQITQNTGLSLVVSLILLSSPLRRERCLAIPLSCPPLPSPVKLRVLCSLHRLRVHCSKSLASSVEDTAWEAVELRSTVRSLQRAPLTYKGDRASAIFAVPSECFHGRAERSFVPRALYYSKPCCAIPGCRTCVTHNLHVTYCTARAATKPENLTTLTKRSSLVDEPVFKVGFSAPTITMPWTEGNVLDTNCVCSVTHDRVCLV